MNQIISAVTSAVVAVVVLFVFIVATKAPTPVQIDTQQPPLGSVTGPDSYFQRETHNGIAYEYNRISMNVASTSSCVIKSPSATSTLVFASAIIKTNQAAETVNFTTGTAMQASTTALGGNFAIAAAAAGNYMASTTNSEATRTFNPNTWLQVNIFGGSGVASSTGTCQAVFAIE